MKREVGVRLLTVSVFLFFLALNVFAINFSSSLKNDLKNLKVRHEEMLLLKEEFSSLKNRIDAVEKKKSLTNVEGVVGAVDEIFQPLSIKEKVKLVKPTARREVGDAVEEEAEVHVEKVDMNELVNIFYKIENVPMLLSLRKTNIRISFENPKLLNVTMTIALIKAK
ncbi:MAG: hypothetical protein AB1638_01985 [Nitrospirota bacterium]